MLSAEVQKATTALSVYSAGKCGFTRTKSKQWPAPHWELDINGLTVIAFSYSVQYSNTVNYTRCLSAMLACIFNIVCTAMMTLHGDFTVSKTGSNPKAEGTDAGKSIW